MIFHRISRCVCEKPVCAEARGSDAEASAEARKNTRHRETHTTRVSVLRKFMFRAKTQHARKLAEAMPKQSAEANLSLTPRHKSLGTHPCGRCCVCDVVVCAMCVCVSSSLVCVAVVVCAMLFWSMRRCSIALPLQLGPSGPSGHPGRCLIHVKTKHTEAPAPAAPRRSGRWGLHVLCFHMHEAPSGACGRPRKARFKAEARMSNIVYHDWQRGAWHRIDWHVCVFVPCVCGGVPKPPRRRRRRPLMYDFP
jgi:hypothetical protein